MENYTGSVKCAQCGLTNFANADACKRCGAVIRATEAEDCVPNPNLHPCQDCGASVSHNAESCPHCGRFFRVLRPQAPERSRAWWAFTIGWGILASSLIAFILSVALIMVLGVGGGALLGASNLLSSRAASNESMAISTLRTISTAESTYYATVGNGSYGTLEELADSSLVDKELLTGEKFGYKFEIRTGPSNNYGSDGFEALATPVRYGSTGVRSFYLSEDGVMRAADIHGSEASMKSTPIGYYTQD
jgi:ribosomal protein L40E